MFNRREQLAIVLLICSLLVGSAVALVDYYLPGTVEDLRVIPNAVTCPDPPQATALAASGTAEPAELSRSRVSRDPEAVPQPGGMDLNRASALELESLPGIGPRTAARILAYRQAHGAFAAVESLQQVRGIGPRTMARLAPLLRVGSAGAADSARVTATGAVHQH